MLFKLYLKCIHVALESVMCDVIKIRLKGKNYNGKWERKPADKY